MATDTVNVWFPVVTLVLGSVLTFVGGRYEERWRANREDQKELRDTERLRAEERRAFDRDVILHLQDAASRAARSANALANAAIAQADTAGPSEDWHQAAVEFVVWNSRTSDDNLRQLATNCFNAQTDLARLATREEWDQLIDTAWDALVEVLNNAGDRLRELG